MYELIYRESELSSAEWDDAIKQISPLLKFADVRWKLPQHAPGKKYSTVNWEVKLGDGSVLTDSKHQKWLRASKCAVILLALGGSGFGKALRSGSVIAEFEMFRLFLKWMSSQGLFDFRALTDEHLVAYRNHVSNRVKQRGRGQSTETTKGLSAGVRRKHLKIVLFLVRLQRLIPAGPDLDPHRAEEILAPDRVDGAEGRTERIPDELFSSILAGAIGFIKDVREPLLDLDRAFMRAKRASENHYDCHVRYKRLHRRNRKKPRLVKVGQVEYDLTGLSRQQQYDWIAKLVCAAFIIIAGLVGMRRSEILSLRRGCISRRSVDGDKMILLNGTLYKTAEDAIGRPCDWVAGWDTADNPVMLAVETLEMVSSRYGDQESEYLFESLPEHRDAVREEQGVSSDSLQVRVNKFAEILGLSGWHFAPHQFRRTFARFVTLLAPNAVLALSRHFQHVSVVMTRRYTGGDPDLVTEILDENFEASLDIVDNILASTKLGGIKGREILAKNVAYRGPEGADERRKLRESLRGDPSFLLIRFLYGDCIYDQNPACHGKVENIGRYVCVACKNCVISDAHRPFWQEHTSALRAERVEIKALGLPADSLDSQIAIAEKVLIDII